MTFGTYLSVLTKALTRTFRQLTLTAATKSTYRYNTQIFNDGQRFTEWFANYNRRLCTKPSLVKLSHPCWICPTQFLITPKG